MADNFTRTGMPEINPFPLTVPATVRALDPELHEYLLRLNRTLLEQHNKSQAGDTTLDWQVLLGLDDLSRYTLGSLGSFSHPTFGLLRARYVRFRITDRDPAARVAGFAIGRAGLEWEIVNVSAKAQDGRPMGLIASEDMPQIGQFGWVVTEGVNLHALSYSTRPQVGKLIQWGKGTLGQLVVESEKDGANWRVNPGSMRLRLEAGSGGGAGGFGPTSISDAELEYGKQIVEFENRLDLVNANSNLFISILGRRVSELTENRAALELFEQLQAGANWANLAQTAAGQAAKFGRVSEVSALATQSYLRDAKVYRDQSGFYAASSIEFRNAASLNAANAAVSSGQAVEASLTAQGYTAQALEYVTLAASVGDNLVKNGSFADPRWEEAQAIPPLWGLWGNQYQKPVIQRYSPGRYGPYTLDMNHLLGATEVGVIQQIEGVRQGKFLLGVDIDYISGTVGNSGVLIQFANDQGVISQASIHFGSTPPVGQTTPANIPYNVRNSFAWSIPVEAPAGSLRAYVYLMNHWLGFGNVQDGTHILWENVYLKRPAYNPVDPNAGQAYTDARITEVNQAIATERDARAQLSTSVDTRFTNVDNAFGTVNTTLGQYDQRITSAANAAGAAVNAVETLRTSVDGNTATLQIYGQSLNGLSGKWGVRTNVNGRITGIELNSGAQSSDFVMVVDRFKMETPFGDITPFEVTASQFRLGVDLYLGRFKILLDTGAVMLVLGLGFGTAGQFIMWFGPSMNPASCSEANGIFYLTLQGSGYFGGTLNAGIITNPARTTVLGPDANVTTGVFGSNGKQRVVTVSYAFTASAQVVGQCPANPVATSVIVDLYRGTSAGGQLIDSRTFTGNYYCDRGTAQDPGFTSEDIAGSFTFNDNTGGTQTAFYAQIRNRSINVAPVTQTLAVISVEQ